MLGVRVEEFFDPEAPEAMNDHGLTEGLDALDSARDKIARAMRLNRLTLVEPANQPHA